MTEQIYKGLAGVVADHTAVSKVNPESNSLLYRGYPVQELAAKLSFEEVALLLWNGELPSTGEKDEFRAFERSHRALDPRVRAAIDLLPLDCHPMDVGRTAVSVLGANHPLSEDSSPEAELTKAKELFAAFPAVVAYDQRRRRGLELVEPREDLDYSQNFLWMTFGEEAPEEVVDAFRVSMVLYAEHSFNASTFTARVVTSTLADLHSAVTAAIGALKGPLHGGANEAVMHTFEEIGIDTAETREDAAARAKAWMEQALAEKRKVMGFGHRVYKSGDSRVPTMKQALDAMVEYYGRGELMGLYDGLEAAMGEAKNILPNLDYPAGPTYHLMGFDTEMFTPLFIAARITGWTAHIAEQRADNALIRPLSAYNGPDERHL
ncbi:bifunctional 2-methylcitrate synthase/citrate synthase [Nesterenkonia sp. LB17]|uniref:bifunctional 2-methylcitrate synthase/citrate synthase n=1 Tax=unclassified Nesterenkonia TaxID=2629769 RepID=UPI001F4CC0A2|nr:MULTISPECIES: bifunctional 2-methylcitrate synthase/citrate synthase [unclassified Nesterenkonia]MCH8561083.1 bifunctional 2-methylcitrate synthase/citrate synthase [Nesterenkonia sp. DZ6]MCH8562614.1 bifunctional 2-methylcitrate synthase/citrate synthase [Nesterenkonia sp. YGD6]MCH8565537.1 bifunctional 2-methylcitrate synthase/citrate synthase [Nesterenkonia sp. LB17]MCH8572112.1 bifunctional 2-methylcitrate synthase/citrate synthase [Nesterenkonia sp. AY15]